MTFHSSVDIHRLLVTLSMKRATMPSPTSSKESATNAMEEGILCSLGKIWNKRERGEGVERLPDDTSHERDDATCCH